MEAKFLLVLLLWGIILATEARYYSDGNNGDDAYLELALKWPNSYCKAKPASCNGSDPPQTFTISYLRLIKRPEGEQTFCSSACNPLSDETIDKYKDPLLKLWPDLSANGNFDDSKKLWKEQWKKYGSCTYPTLRTPEDYINLALTRGKAFDLRSILRSKGILPDDNPYSSRKILNVLRNALGSQVDIACEKGGDGSVYLSEVRQCMDVSGTKLTDCYNRAKDCEDDPIYADKPDIAND